MGKHCIYCSCGIASDSVVDICEKCMYQVWGEKMAKTIIDNMEREKGNGNLELGRVGETVKSEITILEKTPIIKVLEPTE